MQVNDELLTKLEKLSYLKIADNKREEVISQLTEIVNFVDNLGELNTDGIKSAFAMNDAATFKREDIPSCDAQINQDIIKNAPNSDENFFIVPKIIE